MRYRFNLRLIVVSAVALLLLAVTTHFVHAWQMRRHARDQIARADAAELAGEQREAIASLGRALAFEATDHTVRVRQARLLARNAVSPRQRLRALAALESVLPLHGGDLDLRLEAVDLALAANAPQEAARLLRPALHAFPERPDLHERLAQAREDSGQFNDSAEALERALELDPSRYRAAEALARLYNKLDQPRRSVGVLDRLVLKNPKLASAYWVRGRDRMMRGQLDQAHADLETARKLEDTDLRVLAACAELAQRRGLADQAQAFWGQAVELAKESKSPVDPALKRTLTVGLVRSLRDRGKTTEAIESANQGLATYRDDVELTFLLADLLIEKGDLVASEKFSAALPSNLRGHQLYLGGRALQARQQPAAAIVSLVKAHAEPDLPPGLAASALVKSFGDVGRYVDQLAAAREAVRVASTPDSRAELARVLTIHGRGREALRDLRQLSELPVPPDRVWAPLARVLLEQNVEKPVQQRNWGEVERLLDRADSIPSEVSSAALLRSDMLILRDRPYEALEALTKARKRLERQEEEPRPKLDPILYQAEAALAARLGYLTESHDVLARADEHFKARLDWLTAKAGRLVVEQGTGAAAALEELERKSTDLTAEDRDRLTRTLSELHARLGNYAEVERLCGQVLHGDPTDINSHVLFAEARQHRGDLAGAAKLLDALQKIDGPDGVNWRCSRAKLLMAKNDNRSLGEARQLLDEASKSRPNWSYPHLLLGRLDDREQNSALALERYLRVLSLGDYRTEAVRRAVALLLERNRFAEADRVMDRAEKGGALDRELWRVATETALLAGRAERAANLAQQVVHALGKERSYRDQLWLGRILSGAGKNREAEAVLELAARQAPNSTGVWLALVAHYTRANRPADAAYTLERMRGRLAPERVALVQGRAFEILGRSADAERSYRLFLSKNPREVEGLSRLADLYLRTNQPRKAERLLMAMLDSRVLLPEEEQPEVRRRLALAITSGRGGEARIDRALALLEVNRAVEGDSEADRRTQALVTGLIPDDRFDALETLEALPGGPAFSVAERLRLARLYEGEGQWANARRQFASLLAKDKNNTAIMALFIEGLIRQKKFAEAAQWVESLKKLEPGSARVQRYQEQLRKPKAKEPVKA